MKFARPVTCGRLGERRREGWFEGDDKTNLQRKWLSEVSVPKLESEVVVPTSNVVQHVQYHCLDPRNAVTALAREDKGFALRVEK